MFFSIIYNKRVFGGERPVVCCWVCFQGLSGAPLRSFFLRIYRAYCDWASNRILFFRNLSGISQLGFQQDLTFKEASGDLNKPGRASAT